MPPLTRNQLKNLGLDELRQECQVRQYRSSGKPVELIHRILHGDQSPTDHQTRSITSHRRRRRRRPRWSIVSLYDDDTDSDDDDDDDDDDDSQHLDQSRAKKSYPNQWTTPLFLFVIIYFYLLFTFPRIHPKQGY